MTARTARGRWALSFADLSLLLLGFFVLLQANQANRDKAIAGLSSYFGAMQEPHQLDLAAEQLFAPGEALLSEGGQTRLLRAIKPLTQGDAAIRIQSIGLASGQQRFDAWDLSAARLGAVARALVSAGIAADRVQIAGLAEPDGTAKAATRGQTIRIAEVPRASD